MADNLVKSLIKNKNLIGIENKRNNYDIEIVETPLRLVRDDTTELKIFKNQNKKIPKSENEPTKLSKQPDLITTKEPEMVKEPPLELVPINSKYYITDSSQAWTNSKTPSIKIIEIEESSDEFFNTKFQSFDQKAKNWCFERKDYFKCANFFTITLISSITALVVITCVGLTVYSIIQKNVNSKANTLTVAQSNGGSLYIADNCSQYYLTGKGSYCVYGAYCDATTGYICECNSMTYFDTTLGYCVSKKTIGIYCIDSNECNDYLGLICGYGGSCACKAGFVWSNLLGTSQCIRTREVGEQCSATSDCVEYAYCMISTSGVYRCLCPSGKYISYISGRCENVLKIYERCNVYLQQCSPYSTCKIAKLNDGNTYCLCIQGYYYDSTTASCVAQKSLNQACSSIDECLTSLNLDCVNSYCKCPTGTYYNGTYCDKARGYGQSCSQTSDCNSNLICSLIIQSPVTQYGCICSTGYYFDEYLQLCKATKTVGTICYSSIECDENALCALNSFVSSTSSNDSQCTCYPGYTANSLGYCVSLSTYGQACTKTSDCISYYLLSCISFLCGCAQNYYWDGSICQYKRGYTETCNSTIPCRSYQNLTCTSSTCSCPSGQTFNTAYDYCKRDFDNESLFGDYEHDSRLKSSRKLHLNSTSSNNISRPSSVVSHTTEKKNSKRKNKMKIEETDEACDGVGELNELNINKLNYNIPKVLLHSASSASVHSISLLETKNNNKGAKDANENEKHDPNSESQQYLEAKSFIMLEIKLDKPIIPRKPFDVLAKRVSELIPPRPKYPLRNNSAEKAVQDYHSQIKGIVNLVLDDYRKLFTSDSAIFQGSGSLEKYETIDVKRRKLLFELNATGKYFAFKEQLKNSVVKIVREKFFKTSALEDKDQMQTFLSELYVYLVDEMHKAINQIVSIEDLQPIPSEVADLQQMKHFAIEAEMNQNYDLASHYYQERIAREKDNYQNWLDYAAFNFLIEDYPRAEECLKECISINQHEISALLLYGVICTMQEKFEIAEVFFDRVTCNDNENVIAWCLYAMFYEQTNQELNAEISFNKTIKLNHALESLHEQNNNNVEEEHKIDENGDDVNLNKALDSHPKSRGSKRGTSQISKTKSELLKAPKSPATGSVLAPTQSVLGIKSPRSPTRLDDPSNGEQTRKSIFMKTAQFLIEYNAFTWAEKCLAKELVNPKGGPSCEFYVLLAKVKLSRNQLDEAEKNVCLALAIDYQSCEAWTLWGHLKYLIGEFQEAKEKYERVLQFPLLPTDQVHSIYIRLASIYLQEENFEDAKRLFLFACKNSPSCMSWLGVGICCYRLSQLEDSEDALSEANVLNNKAPEVWAYLSLICLKTNRPLEAEQAYKYAIKLNLDNQSLLDEIHALQEQVGFGHVEF